MPESNRPAEPQLPEEPSPPTDGAEPTDDLEGSYTEVAGEPHERTVAGAYTRVEDADDDESVVGDYTSTEEHPETHDPAERHGKFVRTDDHAKPHPGLHHS